MRSYSKDLRARVVKAAEEGMSCRGAAKLFGISPATAVRWVDRQRKTGSYEAKPQGGVRQDVLKDVREYLLALVERQSHITLQEIQRQLARKGKKVAVSTVWNFFRDYPDFCVSGRKPVMEENGELGESLLPFSCRHNGVNAGILQGQKDEFESSIIRRE
jgi:transposase